MNTYGEKAARYAKEAILADPDEKGCQWILQKAEGHAAWDWNIKNHTSAIEFYRALVREHPESSLSYYYLLDNLIADRRADEAEAVLKKVCALKDSRPVKNEVYRAHIALARFNEPQADQIIESLVSSHENDVACLYEAAQYYAGKCDYEKAIDYYERSFANEPRKPRFTDELMGIADICEIMGDYRNASAAYGRIVDLLQNEWGMTEGTALSHAKSEQARLLVKG